ncbi:hypothetical protein HOY80DRAFT_938072 [Tuber brumale]|nr:hypothetical protein HOY80DRAFT_938072 [Tuber brumale]
MSMRSPVPDWCFVVRTVSLVLTSSSSAWAAFENDGGVCLGAVLFKSSSDSSVETSIGAVVVVVFVELPAVFSGLSTESRLRSSSSEEVVDIGLWWWLWRRW